MISPSPQICPGASQISRPDHLWERARLPPGQTAQTPLLSNSFVSVESILPQIGITNQAVKKLEPIQMVREQREKRAGDRLPCPPLRTLWAPFAQASRRPDHILSPERRLPPRNHRPPPFRATLWARPIDSNLARHARPAAEKPHCPLRKPRPAPRLLSTS